MKWQVAADAIVILHLTFVLFATMGALLLLRWPRLVWLHLAAALWAVTIEFTGGICPLTPLENWLRRQGGMEGYTEGFVEHYLQPVLYPADLTHSTQVALGSVVLLINVVIYSFVIRKLRVSGKNGGSDDL